MTKSFLDQELAFFPDRIEIKEGRSSIPVMMSWERPLMERMAQIAAVRRGAVLEVGFGMGICAAAIQSYSPQSHTIIEAHPQIIERGKEWAKDREGVRVIAGRWQDVDVESLGIFDGIAFDIFGGTAQRFEFFSLLSRLLSPRGTATLWLGDDRDLSEDLEATLESQGFTYHLSRVYAVPDKRCTYSQTNEFYIPTIVRKE